MTETLRDPIWQFVGVIISLVALVVAVAAVRFQLLRKTISYFHAYERPVFYLFEPELRERLRITFDNREVEYLSAFNLHIFNNGNVAVPPSDFVVPISVEFPTDSHVFGVSVTDTTPPNLAVQVTGSEQRYVVEPLLLNPGDEFTMQFLVEGADNHNSTRLKPAVNARIAGVKAFALRPHRSGLPYQHPYSLSRDVLFWLPLVVGLLAGAAVNLIWWMWFRH